MVSGFLACMTGGILYFFISEIDKNPDIMKLLVIKHKLLLEIRNKSAVLFCLID